MAVKGVHITDLTPLASIVQLAGGLFEIDVPAGPVAGAYVTRSVTTDQLVAYILAAGGGGPAAPANGRYRGDFQPDTAYLLFDLVKQDGLSYSAAAPFTSGPTFDAADWVAFAGDPAVQDEHTQLLATLAARAANLYAHYADNTVAPFADLDSFLAAAGLHGGTLRLEGEATSLYISANNRGGWPAYWDAAGSTIIVPDGLTLRSSAAGLANLSFANFYLDGGANGTGIFNLTGQLPQTTSAGQASLLFNGQSLITVNNDNNVVLLNGGTYKKITGAGKYYLLGSVEVADQTEASNVVDLRGGTGGGGTGTVKTVNGVAPDAAGNVMLASRDLFGYSQPKRDQVFGLFTSPTQFKAVDVALAGDTSTGLGSQIPDLTNGDLYTLVPDYDNRDAAGNGTPTWLRTSFS
jgi:hypothetical protein